MTLYKSTNIKQRALFYRRRGYSLHEISSLLGIAKSTASLWVGKEKLGSQAKTRLKKLVMAGQRKAALHKKLRTQKMESILRLKMAKELQKVKFSNKRQLKLSLALLYGCEGAKTDRKSRVTFINSDPLLIKQFIRLMRCTYQINENKWSCCLHLHAYHNEQKQIQYWSNITGIPKKQFTKVYQKSNTQKRERQNYEGCLSLRYYDSLISRELYYLYLAFLAL